MASENNDQTFSLKAKEALTGFAANAQAAMQLAAKQAKHANLTNVKLPFAYRNLGRNVHAGARFRDRFPDAFAKVDELQRRIESLREASPDDDAESKTFGDRVKASAVEAGRAARAKTLEVKSQLLFLRLGRSAYEEFGKDSGPPELVGTIEQCRQRLKELEDEIQAIHDRHAGDAVTPRRLLLSARFLAVFLLLFGAWAMTGGDQSQSQVAVMEALSQDPASGVEMVEQGKREEQSKGKENKDTKRPKEVKPRQESAKPKEETQQRVKVSESKRPPRKPATPLIRTYSMDEWKKMGEPPKIPEPKRKSSIEKYLAQSDSTVLVPTPAAVSGVWCAVAKNEKAIPMLDENAIPLPAEHDYLAKWKFAGTVWELKTNGTCEFLCAENGPAFKPTQIAGRGDRIGYRLAVHGGGWEISGNQLIRANASHSTALPSGARRNATITVTEYSANFLYLKDAEGEKLVAFDKNWNAQEYRRHGFPGTKLVDIVKIHRPCASISRTRLSVLTRHRGRPRDERATTIRSGHIGQN